MSCYALMLFGVPNRGLETSSLMAMVKGQPNEALIRDLSESSRFLSLLQSMFYERFTIDSSRIICVYETQMTPTVEVGILVLHRSISRHHLTLHSGLRKQRRGKGLGKRSWWYRILLRRMSVRTRKHMTIFLLMQITPILSNSIIHPTKITLL